MLQPGTLGALTRVGCSPGLPKCSPELVLQPHLAREEGRRAPSQGLAAGGRVGAGPRPPVTATPFPVPLPCAPASQVTLSN